MPDGTTTRRCPRAGLGTVSHFLRAHAAHEKGQLQFLYDPEDTPAEVMDAISLVSATRVEVEAKAWEDSKNGS